MAVTATASEVNAMKSVHVGLNVVRSKFVNTSTISDIIFLAKLPNKATLVDWKLVGGNANAASTGSYKIGFAADANAVFPVDTITGASMSENYLHAGLSLTAAGSGGAYLSSSWSVSASIMVPNFAAHVIPLRVSLSDDAAIRYTWIQATTLGASTTGTHSLHFVMMYIVGE